MPKLTFYGATQQVTGSCYLLDTPGSRVLLDCGLFQGAPNTERQNQRRFPFKPGTVDAVILSHAHLDHSGLLPKLVREGYRGPVYVTRPTLDLMEIMLKDAAFLQAKDMEWENRHRQRAGRKLIAPLYTQEDVQQALALCQSVNYGEKFSVAPGVDACLRDAGHIIVHGGPESVGLAANPLKAWFKAKNDPLKVIAKNLSPVDVMKQFKD